MFRRITRKHPLLTRITIYVFIFATLVSIATSGLLLYVTYQTERKNIGDRLDSIRETHLNTLVNNVWSLDEQAIQIQLQDISRIPDIVYVMLKYGDGKPFIFGSPTPNCPLALQRQYMLEKTVKGKKFSLGTMTVEATTKNIQARLLRHSATTLATQILTLFFTCIFILFLFLLLFNRHINQIVAFTENLEIGFLDRELALNRHRRKGGRSDELDRIVHALNNMRKRLQIGIAAQRSAEENLIREKLFSDTIINSLPGILFVINEKREILRFNQMFKEKLLLSEEEISYATFLDRFSDRNRQTFLHSIEELCRQGQSSTLEIEISDTEGLRIPFLLNMRKLALENELFLITIGTDLTERRKIEEQLRQAQKMEAIGTLAGGVAHDFNNILSAIFGYTELAKLEAGEHQKLQDYLTGTHKAAQRAKELVSQILAFSRKTRSEKFPLQLSLIVKEALKLLRSTLPTTISIRQKIDSEHTIIADPTEIHSVVMNLCTNAFHAMESSGGILSVSMKERVIAYPMNFSGATIKPGTYVQLTIEDTGIGMTEATRQKIFEPYFTTKAPGTGTGLGLAVVHGIVTGHSGFITVYSEPGKGTAFILYLPVAFERPAEITAEEPPLSGQRGGSETIMLVDDEEDILKYYSELLKRFGYRVLTYASSLEAFEAFKKNPQAIDLVITDQTMPSWTGDRLGREMLNIRPDIPVIACSGFSRTLTRKEFIEIGFRDYFQKPIEAEPFLERIREILDKG